MKRLKLAVIALFALVTVTSVNAQDESKAWTLGIGTNVVDFQIPGESVGDKFVDWLGNTDWNFSPISRVSATKYLGKGFSVILAGSFNQINTLTAKDDVDFNYFSLDASVAYDLNRLIEKSVKWFDPYVYLGGSYVSANSSGDAMVNFGAGANFWITDKFGINAQTGSKYGILDNVIGHYQSSLGIVFKLKGLDSDGDGVEDKIDACPEVAGLKSFNGCPDADGDGVKDSEDACPNAAGLASMNGCPDADGDGVSDKDDMCANAKGTKANKGCPDSDGDGVVDKDDKCPNSSGPAANGGCSWPDTDGDGVLDKDDKCPTEAGVASESGCPEVISLKAKMGVDTFANAILFNLNKATFVDGVTKEIDGMVEIMNEFPKAQFEIKGFTDTTGSAAFNLKLSQDRADAVKNYLVNNGIDASRLTSKGYGQENPAVSNATRAGRMKNRRVEVKVTN